jgi:hypothetical protein
LLKQGSLVVTTKLENYQAAQLKKVCWLILLFVYQLNNRKRSLEVFLSKIIYDCTQKGFKSVHNLIFTVKMDCR